jgi:hypothetical protein
MNASLVGLNAKFAHNALQKVKLDSASPHQQMSHLLAYGCHKAGILTTKPCQAQVL